jgi:hypothetical protein
MQNITTDTLKEALRDTARPLTGTAHVDAGGRTARAHRRLGGG